MMIRHGFHVCMHGMVQYNSIQNVIYTNKHPLFKLSMLLYEEQGFFMGRLDSNKGCQQFYIKSKGFLHILLRENVIILVMDT